MLSNFSPTALRSRIACLARQFVRCAPEGQNVKKLGRKLISFATRYDDDSDDDDDGAKMRGKLSQPDDCVFDFNVQMMTLITSSAANATNMLLLLFDSHSIRANL